MEYKTFIKMQTFIKQYFIQNVLLANLKCEYPLQQKQTDYKQFMNEKKNLAVKATQFKNDEKKCQKLN